MKPNHLLSRYFIFISALLFTFSLISPGANAQIVDGLSLEAGVGDQSNIFKIGAQKRIFQDNAFLNEYYLRPYIEFTVAAINAHKYQNIPGQSRSIADIGITPVLRWQKNIREGFFAEIGIGANYMTDRYNNAGTVASTRFEFGDHVGVGYRFNDSAEISLKYQHLSNAGIKRPNPAIDFVTVKLAYWF